MAGGEDRIMSARITEFLSTVNEDVLDETLDTLLLDRYGSLSERSRLEIHLWRRSGLDLKPEVIC